MLKTTIKKRYEKFLMSVLFFYLSSLFKLKKLFFYKFEQVFYCDHCFVHDTYCKLVNSKCEIMI